MFPVSPQGQGDFFNGQLSQQGRIAADIIDSDPFAICLIEFLRGKPVWEGTASLLLASMMEMDGRYAPPQGFPKSNQVKQRLKRLTPALSLHGVTVTLDLRAPTIVRDRLIRLETGKTEPSAVQTVQDVQSPSPEDAPAGLLDDLDNASPNLSKAVEDAVNQNPSDIRAENAEGLGVQ